LLLIPDGEYFTLGLRIMKTIQILIVLTAICALCAGAAPTVRAQQEASSAPSTAGSVVNASAGGDVVGGAGAFDQMGVKKYLLGPGDVLDLRVFGEPQFTDRLQVTDEGFIEIPFLDPIPAKCRTDVEIKKDVTTALKKFLKSPQVSLRVAEARSRPPAVVFGAVRNPQRVVMNRRGVRLLELLSYSGGVTDGAGGEIQLFHTESVMCEEREPLDLAERKVSDDPLALPFLVYRLTDLRVGKLEANPIIRPGDIVIVTEASPVYVTGAVISPQGVHHRDKLLLTRAIAQVGGLRPDAKPSKIRIFRQKPDSKEQEILTVDFDAIRKQKIEDFALQPYDVVEVPDSRGFATTMLNILKGSVPNAANAMTGSLPLRVLY